MLLQIVSSTVHNTLNTRLKLLNSSRELGKSAELLAIDLSLCVLIKARLFKSDKRYSVEWTLCHRYITSLVRPSHEPHTDAKLEASSEATYPADERLKSDSQAGKSSAAILEGVLSAVQSVLGREAAAQDSLIEVGLDSLGAVELRNALSQSFEVELPVTFTFDYPTPQVMAGYIAGLKGLTANDRAGQVLVMHQQPHSEQGLLQAGQPRLGTGMQAITGISVRSGICFLSTVDAASKLYVCHATAMCACVCVLPPCHVWSCMLQLHL